MTALTPEQRAALVLYCRRQCSQSPPAMVSISSDVLLGLLQPTKPSFEQRDSETAIDALDRLFPTHYGAVPLIGLGQFILNIVHAPGDPYTDAENIAIAVLLALEDRNNGSD